MKKDNKRMRKTTHINRIIAVVLSVAMVMSMTPEVFAEPLVAPESMISESAVENTTGNTQSDSQSVVVDESTGIAGSDSIGTGETESSGEQTEQVIPGESTGTGEGTDTDEGTNSGESENTDEAKDTPEEEDSIMALADAGSNLSQENLLTLDEAKSIADNNKDSNGNAPIEQNQDGSFKVYNGTGLILLSNVNPNEYKDKTITLLNTSSTSYIDITQGVTLSDQPYQFLGLGSNDFPYTGELSIDNNNYILSNKTLFNAISTSAKLTGVQFLFNKYISATEGPLLAKQVTDNGSVHWEITISTTSTNETATSATIGGIIGTIENDASANVTLTNNLTCPLTVSGSDHRGLFCNLMNPGSSLNAKLKEGEEAGNITVAASGSNHDAGGYVGHMDGNNILTISGTAVNTVTSDNGNAGGLVGSATNATINVADWETIPFALSGVTVKANRNAGGLVGEYTNSKDGTLKLAQFTLDTTISGKSNAGGVFGTLINNDSYNITGESNRISSQLNATSDNYGGVIGQYNGSNLSTTLSIQKMSSISSNAASQNPTNYGGVIGTIPNSAYVELKELSKVTTQGNAKTNFGGMVADMGSSGGVMLNIGSVKLSRNSNLNANETIGGLVGYLEQGVVRLYDTTDLSDMTITSRGGGTGQIVGKNGNNASPVGGIVYAVGTGNNDGTTGWKLIRNGTTTVSDIGNWGEVVRLDGEKLKETTSAEDTEAPNLFYFNKTDHTVTILGEPQNNYTIRSVRDFAAYALAFDFAGRVPSNVLKGTENVTSTLGQNITIHADIDLVGTGIFGIGRDNGADLANNYFSGTLNGTDKTVILDIGSSYGFASDGTSEATGIGSGLVYVHQSGSTNSGHGYLGLISAAKGTTSIQNIVLEGSIQAAMLSSDNTSWTRAAAAVSYMDTDGILSLSKVEIGTNLALNQCENNKSNVALAAFVGDICTNVSVTFDECTWRTNSTVSTDYYANNRSDRSCNIGGLLALAQKSNSITVKNCTLSGKIVANGEGRNYACVGGLVAEVCEGNSISISNLKVDGERITTTASNTSGGLLGYKWNKTDVTFGGIDSTGVTISGCNLNARNVNTENGQVVSQATFGGLVYQATGYWNATAKDSIKFTKTEGGDANTFSGKSDSASPSGLLVGMGIDKSDTKNIKALYLEVGTWGDAKDPAYKIDDNAVNLNLSGSDYFDELVGITIYNNSGHDNAVVSLATPGHAEIDEQNCNTYTKQLDTSYQNDKTRYYYNLDWYRASGTDSTRPTASSLNSPGLVLSWSVSQYAASNIRDKFCSNFDTTATISGTINLTGYSYYPVTPHKNVTVGGDATTTLIFAYATMNDAESVEGKSNKPFEKSNQHYLMHHGLLYNAENNVTVTSTRFEGTIGKQSTSTENKFNSGALIFGSVNGNASNSPVIVCTVQLKNVTLAGLKVSGLEDSTLYMPLLINTIGEAVTLTVNDLFTDTGYIGEDGSTAYAATSLIGNVGNLDATNIKLEFSNIALDSRVSADPSDFVWNNGQSAKCKVEYNTTHTIFTRATLLESFQYTSDSSGVYNFNSYDTKVTYGVEISNTESGRNLGEQYRYYDNDDYAWDGTDTKPDKSSISTFYSTGKYLRYVKRLEGEEGNYHELDINLRTADLDVGCGTYGHPYQITNGKQLTALADYLANGRANKWVVCVNEKVFSSNKQESDSYHTDTSVQGTYEDNCYMCDGETWYEAIKGADDKFTKGNEKKEITVAKMRAYLRNAYYQIQEDINISSSTYMGIGGNVTSGDGAIAFSGVIVGKNTGTEEAPKYPTVYISSTISSAKDFGGLVRYSQGSVIKNLTVSYAGGTIIEKTVTEGTNTEETTAEETKKILVGSANITMSNSYVPSSSNTPFFGGVVGYCMGGDTIIDNVSVKYGTDSVKLDGEKARLIAAGGYVGLVGGAKNSDGYEKTGGGVVFRNMNGGSTFEQTLPQAAVEENVRASNGLLNYFYCNPYVGRVLDGYACYDTQKTDKFVMPTLNNTDKNYTIPNLYETESGIDFSVDNSFNVVVNSEQGLWLLSAIVNSGAGAMDSNYAYKDMYNGDVDAYNLGKPRSALYDNIGTAEGDSDLADEAFWGGVSTIDKSRVSYLVKKYTAHENEVYYAAKITGGSSSRNSVSLKFNTNSLDMSSYKNGFRGIGSSFGNGQNTWDKTDNLKGRFLYVKKIAGNQKTTKICLGIDRHDYWDNYDQNGWFVRGTGLFTGFSYQTGCAIEHLTLTGKVKLTIYNVADGTQKDDIEKNRGETKRETYGDITVGGFAGHTVNASGEFSFDYFRLEGLDVYGGLHAAGAIGLLEQAGGIKNVIFTNWSIGEDSNNKGVSVSKKTYDDGSSGGLLGWCRNGEVKITGYGKESTEWNVNNLTVNVTSSNRSTAAAGGLVGATDGTVVTVSGVRVKNLTIVGKKAKDVGGLVAENKEKGASVTIEQCYFNNLDISGEGSQHVGGVLGRIEKSTTINDVTITGTTSIYGNNGYVGGMIGYANTQAPLNDCHISGNPNMPAKISSGTVGNYVGGLIGYNSSTTIIKDCTEKYVNILSGNNNAGGLTGQLNNTTNASNVTFTNVNVATSKNDKYVGLLTGNTNGKTFNGYNILAENCTVGYNTDATIENLGTLKSDNNNVGLWFGNSSGTSTVVAVAVNENNQPQKEVGNGTASITYADYPVEQTNQPKSGTASPWLDVNPEGTLSVKKSDSATAQTLTGNGVGDGVAQKILVEVTSTNNSMQKKYCNLTSIATDIAKFLPDDNGNYTNDVYLTTYLTEEEDTLTSGSNLTDFPILVVSGLADANAEIWNYIAALTNVKNGQTAKDQVESITPITYQWQNDSFVKLNAEASLRVDESKIITITPNAYDNQKSQFTLLDVKYNNPTNGNSNGFHLFVPVLVKKVLEVSFNAECLAGTNYRAAAYKDAASYATAGLNEPVTSYIEYNYDHSLDDWKAMLDNGENLLWSYQKILNLGDINLPKGTCMTLVDRRTWKHYTYKFDSETSVKSFNLSQMTVPDSTSQFTPVPICDLLGLVANVDNDNGTYVMTDKENATVKVDDQYYRKVKSGETGDKYAITIGADITESAEGKSYLSQGEGYYLTLWVPSYVNNPLNYADTELKSSNGTTGAPPAKIISSANTSGSRYVIYNGVEQEFTLATSNGKDDTAMENGDCIQITQTSILSLTDDGKDNFNKYGPTEVNHQFNVNMKKYLKDKGMDAALIGAEGAMYTYTIKKDDDTLLCGERIKSVPGSEMMETLQISCVSDEAVDMKDYLKENALKEGTSLTITAVITLPYPNAEQYFPGRGEGDTESGINVEADSRVANDAGQLPITSNKIFKKDDDGKKRYYTKNPSSANLTYYTIDSGGYGDTTQQLGINPLDTESNVSDVIYTEGDYDYSGVDADTLSNAKHIRYTLELLQKENNGSYSSVDISNYLTSVETAGETWDNQTTPETLTRDIAEDDATHRDFIYINLTPLTGKIFEDNKFTYANYKVRLTAVLLDEDGNELTGTKASDYIIYTNARIYQQMIQ